MAKKKRSQSKITFTGKSANSLFAMLCIDAKGINATDGTSGKLREEIERQLREAKLATRADG